jgi:bifunctional DNase/RNase
MKRGIIGTVIFIFWLFPLALHASQHGDVVEMKVKRVFLDRSAQTRTAVVILENAKEKAFIPIWIGDEEATSIAIELEHVATPRPNTHDLIRNILDGFEAAMQQITITDLRDNIYYAVITLKLNGQEVQIDSRPSDAIAVALRMKAPIYASTKVLAKAKQLPSPETPREGFRKIMGIHLQELSLDLAHLFKAKIGVLVAYVELGSAASKAGIHRGDIIFKVDGQEVHKVGDLESFLDGVQAPMQIKMEVLREGRPTSLLLDLPS